MSDLTTGILAGFCLGWGAASVLALLVIQFDHSRGYDRWRRARAHEQRVP